MATPSSRVSMAAAAGARRVRTFGSLERKRRLISGDASNHTAAAVAAPITSNAAKPNQTQRSPPAIPGSGAGAGAGAGDGCVGAGAGGVTAAVGGGASCPCFVLIGYCDQ